MSDANQPSMLDLFGPVISSYSRAQAIEDGMLVDLSQANGAKGHFKFPLACTAAVWALIEQAIDPANGECNDLAGVLHDICWMSKSPLAYAPDPTTRLFDVILAGVPPKSGHGLKMVCGPGDTPEPVLTIMLPEED